MTDIFNLMAEKVGQQCVSECELSGDIKKTQYVLELIGSPSDPDTLKCIIRSVKISDY